MRPEGGGGGALTESNAPTPTVRRNHSWYRPSEPEAWLGSRLLRPVPAIPALPAEIESDRIPELLGEIEGLRPGRR